MKKTILIVALLLMPPASGVPAGAPEDEFTIAAVGDIMLGGRAEPYLREHGPAYPFKSVLPALSEADVVVGNLESPISTRGQAVKNKKFTLRAGPLAADALKEAGFRVVSLANNHAMDFGPLALQDTLAILSEKGILFSGAGMDLADARAPALLKTGGRTLAFLSYSLTFPLEFFAAPARPGTAPGYADYVREDIRNVRSRADIVVVSFHWGAEVMFAAKDYQVALGHQAIDWGADLVLGHHPHVLQELEVYKGRLIAYSLGNFVFGSESNRTNESIILLCRFKGNTFVKAEAVPLDVNNYRVRYQPRVLTGAEGAAVLDRLAAASARFKTPIALSGDRAVVRPPEAATARAPGN
jgi:poly-gamma-glutamate synthesis protein (capsule biosynthesis protein)